MPDETIEDVTAQIRNSDRFAEISALGTLVFGTALLISGAVSTSPETVGLLIAAAGVLGLSSERVWWLLDLAGVEEPDDRE